MITVNSIMCFIDEVVKIILKEQRRSWLDGCWFFRFEMVSSSRFHIH